MGITPDQLVDRVQLTAEIGSEIGTTLRIRGPWLEVTESTETDCYIYWVRANNMSAKGYDVVEHPSDDPDQMDLDLLHNFPQS